MPEVQHRTLGPGSNHVNHDFVAASATARLNLAVTEADVGKDCMQTDTSPPTFWRLARVGGGVSWTQLAGGAGMTTEQANALTAATNGVAALRTPVYLVQALSDELGSERVVTGADGVQVDYSTPGQAIIRGPTIPAAGAPVGAQYIVGATDATLTAERVLTGTAPVTVDFATNAGQAIVAMPAATTGAPGHMTAAHATALAGKADTTTVNTALAAKADRAYSNNPQAGNYTPTATDTLDRLTFLSSPTAATVTISAQSLNAIPALTPIRFMRYGTGVITFTAGAGVTLLPANNLRLANIYDTAEIIRISGDTWVVKGEVVV